LASIPPRFPQTSAHSCAMRLRSQARSRATLLILIGLLIVPTSWAALLDTDGDGIPDAVEVETGTNPNLADSDNDGLSDGDERAAARTLPFRAVGRTTIPAGGSTKFAVGDLDGDGDPDLAVHSNAGFSWRETDGSGFFAGEFSALETFFINDPAALLAADLDGDTDLDLITGRSTGPLILENDGGTWTFERPQPTTTLSHPANAFAMGDLDGDGDMDFAGSHAEGVFWMENLGGPLSLAGFTTHVLDTLSFATSTMDLVDLDGDDDLDLLYYKRLSQELVWLENEDGDGTFSDPIVLPELAGWAVAALGVGDIDCDGDPDILVAGRDTLYWLDNLGLGTFAVPQVLATGESRWPRPFVADLDGDGDVDVVRGELVPDELSWFENDGSGTFQNRGPEEADGPTYQYDEAIYLDADGDGNLDVLLHRSWYSPGLKLFENPGSDPTRIDTDGDGLDDGEEAAIGTNPKSIDTDSDGLTDFFENLHGRDPLTPDDELTDADGDGLHEFAEQLAGTDPHIIDTDGDGLSDAFEVRYGFDPLVGGEEALDSDGDGVSNLDEQMAGTNPTLIDADGDGLSDDEEVSVFGSDPALPDTDGDGVSDGDEVFRLETAALAEWVEVTTRGFPVGSGGNLRAAQPADFDGDGDLDLAYLAPTGGELLWLANLGDGTGEFDAPHVIDDGYRFTYAVTHAIDVDEDSDVDLVVCCGGDDGPTVYLNDAFGNFAPSQPLIPGFDANDRIFGFFDIDGSGRIDVLTREGWYRNLNGSGTFGPLQPIPDLGYPDFVRVGDLDGDGDGDVIAIGPRDENGDERLVMWLENRGAEGFIYRTVDDREADSSYTARIWPVDADEDGDLDLVASMFVRAQGSTREYSIYENLDGMGLFSRPQPLSIEATPLLVTNLDRIRSADVIFARDESGSLSYFESPIRVEFRDYGNNIVQTPIDESIPLYRQPAIAAADLDGDGDPDLLTYDNFRGLGFFRNPGTSPTDQDSDGDGLSDGDEITAGTDPSRRDTDGDGLLDGFEFNAGLNPLVSNPFGLDLDGDGLSAFEEQEAGTDPGAPDTDRDGMGDLYEVLNGLDPLVDDALLDLDRDGLTNIDELGAGTKAGSADSDLDGISDSEESGLGLDPLVADSDGDGLRDGEERETFGTDPTRADSDGDELRDGYEVRFGLDPLVVNDATVDLDADGLDHLGEQAAGSRPDRIDTDGDGLADGDEGAWSAALADTDGDGLLDPFEQSFGLSPSVDESRNDGDADGLDNLEEQAAGTDPRNPDTDEDGLTDGEEVIAGRGRDIDWIAVGSVGSIGGGGHDDFAVSDLDGDGDDDLISGSRIDDQIPWYENVDGSIPFGTQVIDVEGLVLEFAYQVASKVLPIDLDGDGDQDLIFGNQQPLVAWLENLGGGTYGPYQTILDENTGDGLLTEQPVTTGVLPNVLAGDFDSDGDADLLATISIASRETVVLIEHIDGRGGFGLPRPLWTSRGQNLPTAVADLDGDGIPDWVSGGDQLTVHLTRDRGKRFEDIVLREDLFVSSVDLGDVDGDDDLDISYGPNFNTTEIGWVENVGGGLFASPVVIEAATPISGDRIERVTWTDVDSDSDLDLVIYRWSFQAPAYWVENEDGQGTFTRVHILFDRASDGARAYDLLPGGGNELLQVTRGFGITVYRAERELALDPTRADTDFDGMPDGWEVEWGFDPLINDASLDGDFDGLSALGEYQAGANPTLPDTDGDGLSDGDEVNVYGSDPLVIDSDGDGLDDFVEVDVHGTSPANADSDTDGLSDGDEVLTYMTDPTDGDSDDDGVPDGFEVAQGYDPNGGSEGELDLDGDGLSNAREFELGTDADDTDSDDDGLSDSAEVEVAGTDPLDPDSDDDGRSDGEEVNVLGTDPLDPDITAPTTVADLTGGTYDALISVNLSCSDAGGAPCRPETYYTLDGSEPTLDSETSRGPLEISVTSTLRFFSRDQAGNREAIQSIEYIIDAPDFQPRAFELISPSHNDVAIDPTDLEFIWEVSSDPNDDPLTYELYLCESADFVGCMPTMIAARQTVLFYAGVAGPLPIVGMSMILLGAARSRRRGDGPRRPRGTTVMAVILLATALSGCSGGGGSESPSTTASAQLSQTMTGLMPNTSYYWKVVATDGTYQSESETRSFTTQ